MRDDKQFPKSNIFKIKWRGLPPKIQKKRKWKPLYVRLANSALIYFLFFEISWRLPYLPEAAYEKGWDACFRQGLKKRSTEGLN